jgi:hypothetical protein
MTKKAPLKHPLRTILNISRDQWDRPEIPRRVRDRFSKTLMCGTPALGAEVYSSETEEKVVCYSCKSKACPSCGQRRTLEWQREQWAALPDIPYTSVVFTMPDLLWPIFQRNRQLIPDLAALGAAVIEEWARNRYGVEVAIMAVTHTFGRHLNFNCHVHLLVSSGGLKEVNSRWIQSLRFDKRELMELWRYAVVNYLGDALRSNELSSDQSVQELNALLQQQSQRRWIIDIRGFVSKDKFLRYAGRYVRRPPIAESRFLRISNDEVVFETKDHKKKRLVETRYSLEEFVSTLGEHLPDRYQHGMRYFGLLAPRSKNLRWAALFILLGQKKRPRPHRLSWRNSLLKYFGVDPLIDSRGQPMHWTGRRKPIADVNDRTISSGSVAAEGGTG